MVNPGLIHSNKSTQAQNQFHFWYNTPSTVKRFSCECVFDLLWSSAAPILPKAFQCPILHAKYVYPTRSFGVPIISEISRTFIRRSSNTISCTCSMISGVVAFFGRPSRGSSSRLVRPRLNSAARFLIVENEGEESP
jgi:hypothetical protein